MEIPSTLCSNVYDFAFCPEPCYDRLVDLADCSVNICTTRKLP